MELNEIIMCILTAVYVGATWLIWKSNKISAEAANKSAIVATEQLSEMKNIQQQNVRLQLFERRYSVYVSLSYWFRVAKEVAAIFVGIDDVTENLKRQIFDSRIFGTSERLDKSECLNEIRELEKLLSDSKIIKQKGELTEEEKTNLLNEQKMNQDRLDNLQKKLSSHRNATNKYLDEYYEIELCEYIYEDLDFSKINGFIKAFDNMFIQNTPDNLRNLEHTYKVLDVENTLQKIKEQLKISEVS